MGGIGIIAVLIFLYARKDTLKMSCKAFVEYFVICTVYAFVLSRIMFVVAAIPSMEKITFNGILHQILNGGIVFYGGLFGVILGILSVSKYRGRNPMVVLNKLTPAFPLFHAFARIGCLLVGCCYGIECSWGVIMIDEPNVVRFPVQLFESICNVCIFIGILIYEKTKRSSRNNLRLYLCTYATCRFVLEFFRGDSIRGIWGGGLSTAQYVSLGILIFCLGSVIKSVKGEGR